MTLVVGYEIDERGFLDRLGFTIEKGFTGIESIELQSVGSLSDHTRLHYIVVVRVHRVDELKKLRQEKNELSDKIKQISGLVSQSSTQKVNK